MLYISYFIFHTMQHWKKRRCLYFMFVPFFIAYTISYVQISYVHLYAQVTIGRTYFSAILFFSAIKNVVSSISTGVPLKIFQPSLSHSSKSIFLRFILFFTVHFSPLILFVLSTIETGNRRLFAARLVF